MRGLAGVSNLHNKKMKVSMSSFSSLLFPGLKLLLPRYCSGLNGPEWTRSTHQCTLQVGWMDDVWIGNTFSLYSCLVSIHGGKSCTNHPHSSIYLLPFPIYLSTYIPYLLTYSTLNFTGSYQCWLVIIF